MTRAILLTVRTVHGGFHPSHPVCQHISLRSPPCGQTMTLDSLDEAHLLNEIKSELVGVTVGDSDHRCNFSSVGRVIESAFSYQYADRWVLDFTPRYVHLLNPYAEVILCKLLILNHLIHISRWPEDAVERILKALSGERGGFLCVWITDRHGLAQDSTRFFTLCACGRCGAANCQQRCRGDEQHRLQPGAHGHHPNGGARHGGAC